MFEFWMIENLGSLLQQTGWFSESWIWTVSESWIWTVSESRIWTYFEPKSEPLFLRKWTDFSWYPEEDIIWILNRENLGSLLQQTRRFSGAKFWPIIFKIWMKNRGTWLGQVVGFFGIQFAKIFTILPLQKLRKISHLNFEIKTVFWREKPWGLTWSSGRIFSHQLSHWIKF